MALDVILSSDVESQIEKQISKWNNHDTPYCFIDVHSPPHLSPFLLQLNLDIHEFAPQFLIGGLHRVSHHLWFLRLPSLLKGRRRRGCVWWHSTLSAQSGLTECQVVLKGGESVAAPPPLRHHHHHHHHVIAKPTSLLDIADGLRDRHTNREKKKRQKNGESVLKTGLQENILNNTVGLHDVEAWKNSN